MYPSRNGEKYVLLALFSVLLLCSALATQFRPHLVVNLPDDELRLLHDPVTGTPFKNCGGSESILESVAVIPCDVKYKEHCVISRGSNVTFKITFLAQENSNTLRAKIHGIIHYFPVPFPCPQPNACENSGIICPIVDGRVYNYTLSAPILLDYPKTSLWVEGQLEDDNGYSLVCIKVPVKIV